MEVEDGREGLIMGQFVRNEFRAPGSGKAGGFDFSGWRRMPGKLAVLGATQGEAAFGEFQVSSGVYSLIVLATAKDIKRPRAAGWAWRVCARWVPSPDAALGDGPSQRDQPYLFGELCAPMDCIYGGIFLLLGRGNSIEKSCRFGSAGRSGSIHLKDGAAWLLFPRLFDIGGRSLAVGRRFPGAAALLVRLKCCCMKVRSAERGVRIEELTRMQLPCG